MPPVSPEQPYTPEDQQFPIPPEEQYLDIERGDVDFGPQIAPMGSNQQGQQTARQSQTQQPSQNQQPVDPVEIVKGMISAGFTPTRAQIMNASQNLSGPQESSNTWFAIFLKRLLEQKNKKRK